MGRPRNRNRGTEEFVARKQARMMGLYNDSDVNDVLKAIDAKGGDYYRTGLNPNQELIASAEDDFNAFRLGTPAMEQLGGEMRAYYGLGGTTAKAPEVIAHTPVDSQVVATSKGLINEGPVQGPQELLKEKVEQVKQNLKLVKQTPEKVEEDLFSQQQVEVAEQQLQQQMADIDRQIDQIAPAKGLIVDDPYLDSALLLAAALGTGGIVGRVTAPQEEEEDDTLMIRYT